MEVEKIKLLQELRSGWVSRACLSEGYNSFFGLLGSKWQGQDSRQSRDFGSLAPRWALETQGHHPSGLRIPFCGAARSTESRRLR